MSGDSSFQFYTFGRGTPLPAWPLSGSRRVNRLYYICGGEAFVRQPDGTEQLLAAGRWYLFPERFLFFIRQSVKSPVDHIFFDFTVVPGLLTEQWMDLSALSDPLLDAALRAAGAFAEKYPFPRCADAQIRVMDAYFQILFYLLSQSVHLPRLAESRIALALNYIHTHFSEPVSVRELAALTHTEENHFIRLFFRTMQETPYQYLKNYRLNRAAYELQRGVPVAEAAAHAGYQSSAAFSKAYRRATGKAPCRSAEKNR